jgi:DNA polymerase-4
VGWYLHIDMDAFFASVEQALDPALKGKPVIVGGKSARGVVTSASYEAREYGVHSAMPAFQAKKLCPHGIFLSNRHRVYSEFSHRIFAILEQYSPDVHALSIDEGLVDLTGTERLLGPPLKIAHEIILRIKKELDLTASGGLSTSRVVAKIAATLAKPNGFLCVPPGSEEAFLSPLPVAVVPGVGPRTREELLRQGIKTLGDLLKNPDLRSHYFDFDEGAREGRRRDHSMGNETTLDSPLKDREKLEAVLWDLVEELGGRLRQENCYSRSVTVKIRYTDFKTITRSRTIPTPTCFDREIFEIARDLLRKNLELGRAVRLLGVSAGSLSSSGWQQSLFDVEKRRSWEQLYRGIDYLREKYGEETILGGASQNSGAPGGIRSRFGRRGPSA